MGFKFLGDEDFWEATQELPESVRGEFRELLFAVMEDPAQAEAKGTVLEFKGYPYPGLTIIFAEGRGILPYIVDWDTKKVRGLPPVFDEDEWE